MIHFDFQDESELFHFLTPPIHLFFNLSQPLRRHEEIAGFAQS